jgi:hypothetical protein
MSTYNRLDLQTIGFQPIMPKNLPDHWQVPMTGKEENGQASLGSNCFIILAMGPPSLLTGSICLPT